MIVQRYMYCQDKKIKICIAMLTYSHDISTTIHSGEAKHSNKSCYANLQLSRTIKTILNLHSMTCCYA